MLREISTDARAALIQQLPQAVVFVDNGLKIVYVSDRWLSEFALEREQTVGKSVVSLLHKKNTLWAENIQNTFSEEVSNTGLENYKDQDGNDHWFEWRHNPWYDTNGKAIGTIIEFQNITDTIFDDIKIEQFEDLLKDSSDNQKIGSWEYDAIKDQFSFCEITAAIFGVEPQMTPGMGDIASYFKEGKSRKNLVDALEKARNKGVPWNQNLIVINSSGLEVPVESVGKPIFKSNEFLGFIGTISDISERIIEKKKHETKEWIFQSIFHSSYQFTGILDLDGTFLEINDTALKFAELKREDIVGKKFWEAYWYRIPKEVEGALKIMISKAAGGEVIRTEITAFDRQKRAVPVDFSLKPIFDDHDKVISILAEGRMIIEMVKAREELKMSERQFRALYELSPVGYILSELESGQIMDMNPSFCEATGFQKNQAENLKFSDVMQVADDATPGAFTDSLLDNGSFGPLETILLKENGEPYPALVSAAVLTNKRRKQFVWTVVQDLSEIKSKEKELQEERLLLRTLIDNLPLNVFVKDRESRKILVNKSEVEFCGFKHESEVLGKDDFDLFPEATAKISRAEDLQVMNDSESMIRRETVHIKEDGTRTNFFTSKIPLKKPTGEVIGLIGLSVDITNIKQKEQELNDLIEITSDQNKKLVTFAHIVSHDLRSHTANFSMLLNFLENETQPEERERILTMLTDASDNLLDTLRSLNEVVEISTNINIEKVPLEIYSRINSAALNLSGLIKKTKTRIIIEIPEEETVQAVPAYLDSILINFITNAIKYKHPDRSPIIRMTMDTEGIYKVLRVEDNGLGIDLDQYGNKIFGMYKTFHSNPDARGIGLYLTKNQIEAMNGKVQVESTVGKGSVFKVYFNEEG